MKKVLAIDFDGTIVDFDFPNIGDLRPYAKEVINALYDDHIIIIWTTRDGKDQIAVEEFLEENEIKYHYINKNADEVLAWLQGDPRKIYADIYIDDRNIMAMIDWPKIGNIFGVWKKIIKQLNTVSS